VLRHPTFLAGQAYTRFVDETPELLQNIPTRRDRATKLLRALAQTLVNGSPALGHAESRPAPLFMPEAPPTQRNLTPEDSPAMAVFRRDGAEGLSRWLRDEAALQITDTTMRDAHQSLLATRVRTIDMLAVAPSTAHLSRGLFSVEMWGGATFDVAYRFLKESPWQRLERLREAMPNLLFQMLLRGANGVGYTNYPDNVIRRFVREAAAKGIDVFRIFDALNWVPNMALAMEEVAKAGKIVEACLCYTADIDDSKRSKYDLDYYVNLGRELAKHGAHILAIKDMAGLLKPAAARRLIPALRDETGLPVHLHTHDTSGNGIATYLAAVEAGVDVVDCALSSMSGLTSQPSLNALLQILEHHPRKPALDADVQQSLANYWERVRDLYRPFESGLKASTAEVYWHEIPGGQYSNLRPRAIQLGLGERWEEIKERYREVNFALGDIIKVTPSSKVVADFAMFLVQNNLSVDGAIAQADRLDFPQSLVSLVAGELGQPYGGIPEVLQNAVLKGRPVVTSRMGESLADHDFDAAASRLKVRLGREPNEASLLSDALYPLVYEEYVKFQDVFGDAAMIPTVAFLYGPDIGEELQIEVETGKTLIVKLNAIGGLDDQGQRMVYFELNGQPREVVVRDDSASADLVERLRADASNPGHLGASMPGKVIKVLVAEGDTVSKGETVMVLEAMKMETSVSMPADGVIKALHAEVGEQVRAGDLFVEVD